MRLIAGFSAFLATASVVIVLAAGPAADSKTPGTGQRAGSDDPLIVHEWGTFTSFSGSDGVRLEFRPLADEDLPPFVLDRFLQAGLPSFGKRMITTRLRMETPVTYFYTERERDVNVRVDFPQGLLTEFYPPVVSMTPHFKRGEDLLIRNSSLDWGKVHLIPQDFFQVNIEDKDRARLIEERLLGGMIPPAAGENHYFHARETDSAVVQVHLDPDPKLPRRPAGDFFEKFLFYRGIGNFELPLKLTASGGGKYELLNSGPDDIRSLFLVTADGEELRFSKFDQIASGQQRTLTQNDKAATMEELSEAVVQSLIDENLYEKEARAMVKTWRSSWFGEAGTRLFYMVPTAITEKLLPLKVEPKPAETVRVLVGRMEIMPPETEQKVLELVRTSYAERVQQIKKAQAAQKAAGPVIWSKELASLGRLTEPALARVRAIAPEREIRIHAAELIKMLQSMPPIVRNGLVNPEAKQLASSTKN